MNSRQRFLETMRGGRPDHPPLFDEGLRDEALEAWRSQGVPSLAWLQARFHYDQFEDLDADLYPRPALRDWSRPPAVLRQLRRRLDPDDPRRLPRRWNERVQAWRDRSHVLFLTVHQGLFLTLGVEEWQSFAPAVYRLADAPGFVGEVLSIQAEFAARLAANILSEVQIDAAIFSEPIAGNHGSLISPRMYRELVLPSYAPVFDVLERYRVPVVIWRSYANPQVLIPEVAKARFNAVWPCEAPPGAMEAVDLRRALGPAFGLIGGIHSAVLYRGREEIRRAVEAVLPLVAQGRFIPLSDGRAREDLPFANYAFYRDTLESLVLKNPEFAP